jgi:phenylpyruvate tautomerase PptA (4-oxalocrotonate tautomerase family)
MATTVTITIETDKVITDAEKETLTALVTDVVTDVLGPDDVQPALRLVR